MSIIPQLDYNDFVVNVNPSSGLLLVPNVKNKSTTIRYPVEEIDYDLGGCYISWLRVRNISQARDYYRKKHPYLTEDIIDFFAASALEKKVMAELNDIIK